MDSNFNFSEAAIFVYFIGPVVSIIAIMAAVILVRPKAGRCFSTVHPEWVKKPKLAHADRPQIEIKK